MTCKIYSRARRTQTAKTLRWPARKTKRAERPNGTAKDAGARKNTLAFNAPEQLRRAEILQAERADGKRGEASKTWSAPSLIDWLTAREANARKEVFGPRGSARAGEAPRETRRGRRPRAL